MRATGQEPVAVLGIGAMGHGMATSALRAGIPTIVWKVIIWPLAASWHGAAPTASPALELAGWVLIAVLAIPGGSPLAHQLCGHEELQHRRLLSSEALEPACIDGLGARPS
jgi:3-hydroxyisobutyrate dehydrogenase-like beta-hydroxyacid dehydrogenase